MHATHFYDVTSGRWDFLLEAWPDLKDVEGKCEPRLKSFQLRTLFPASVCVAKSILSQLCQGSTPGDQVRPVKFQQNKETYIFDRWHRI